MFLKAASNGAVVVKFVVAVPVRKPAEGLVREIALVFVRTCCTRATACQLRWPEPS